MLYGLQALALMLNLDNVAAISEDSSHIADLSLYDNNVTAYGALWTSVGHYGGAMSTAKAALQIDARQLANNLGPKNIRVNLISAGPYASRAARAIGDIQQMIDYAAAVSPESAHIMARLGVGILIYIGAGFVAAVVGIGLVLHGRHAVGLEQAGDALGVVLVHLAPKGAHDISTGHGRQVTREASRGTRRPHPAEHHHQMADQSMSIGSSSSAEKASCSSAMPRNSSWTARVVCWYPPRCESSPP